MTRYILDRSIDHPPLLEKPHLDLSSERLCSIFSGAQWCHDRSPAPSYVAHLCLLVPWPYEAGRAPEAPAAQQLHRATGRHWVSYLCLSNLAYKSQPQHLSNVVIWSPLFQPSYQEQAGAVDYSMRWWSSLCYQLWRSWAGWSSVKSRAPAGCSEWASLSAGPWNPLKTAPVSSTDRSLKRLLRIKEVESFHN